MSKIFSTKW